MQDYTQEIMEMGIRAKEAARSLRTLSSDEKKNLGETVKVDVKNFDEHKILSIIAADKNNLRTKEDVVPELEKYIEAGSIIITDDFDFYDAYEKAMEMRF